MFSIIIPLYNKEKEIFETLNSVLNQTFTDFEVIIVDDGSTDNSPNIVNSFLDNRIKLIRKKNGGVSSARHKGITVASKKYIAFLDADDLWDINYLKEMYILIQKYPTIKIFSSLYKYKSKTKYIKPKFPNFKNKKGDIVIDNYFKYLNHSPIITSSSSIIAKEIFDDIGSFNEKLTHGEDLDLWMRICKEYKLVIKLKYLVIYNTGANNRVCNKIPEYSRSIVSILPDKKLKISTFYEIRYYNKIKLDFMSQYVRGCNKKNFLRIRKKLKILNVKSLIFKIFPFWLLFKILKQ